MIESNDYKDIEHKISLLKEDWYTEIEKGLNHLKPIIKKEFSIPSFFGFNLWNPFVDIGANTYINNAKKIAIKQMDIAFQCAIEAIDTNDLKASIDKYFPRFLELDELYRRARRNHEKFDDIVNSLREEFTLRIQDTINLLTAKPKNNLKIEHVGDVYKIAYNNDFYKAKKIQEQEIAYIEKRISWVQKHKNLVYIPFGLRDKVLKIIKSGINYTKNNYLNNLKRYFQQ
ncbi:MAG: hypothetical protein ACTSWN_11930 [Promethearchaeota archaeon]